MCMYYDSAMLYSVTFDFMVRRGIDYENSSLVAYSLRQIKFIGCTGTVMISKESNDKESVMYYMY